MRWLTLAGLALALALSAEGARADLPPAVCQPYAARVSGGSDIVALKKALTSIPAGCPGARRQAVERIRRLAASTSSHPAPASAEPAPPQPPAQRQPSPRTDLASQIETVDEGFDAGHVTRAARDSEYKTTLAQLTGRTANAAAGGLVDYLSGSVALDEGDPANAVKSLDGVAATLGPRDPSYARKKARVLGRLGEAYRLRDQPEDARKALEAANAAYAGVDNYNAELQLILLDLGRRDYADARHAAEVLVFQRTPTRAGLAEAYTALAMAQWGDAPKDEPAAWKYVDLALAADPNDARAKSFADTLPPRLSGPDLSGPPAASIDFNDVEAQARTCYNSVEDRDDYLDSISLEVIRITGYIKAINQYLATLSQRDLAYQARGYDFHAAIMQELGRWKGPGEAATKRSQALSAAWYPYVAAQAAPSCFGKRPARLPAPAGYDPAKPA